MNTQTKAKEPASKEAKAGRVTSTRDLTKEHVLQIWTQRAGKRTNKQISEDLNIEPWLVSDVITRGGGPKVPIPTKIKEAALATVFPHPRKKGSKGKGKKNAPTISDIENAVPAFYSACLHMHQAELKCAAVGVSEDTLAMLRTAAREQAALDNGGGTK